MKQALDIRDLKTNVMYKFAWPIDAVQLSTGHSFLKFPSKIWITCDFNSNVRGCECGSVLEFLESIVFSLSAQTLISDIQSRDQNIVFSDLTFKSKRSNGTRGSYIEQVDILGSFLEYNVSILAEVFTDVDGLSLDVTKLALIQADNNAKTTISRTLSKTKNWDEFSLAFTEELMSCFCY